MQIHYGYGLKDTPINRLAWIILDWKLKVFSRPCWNTKLHIRTWISKIDTICCFRDFEVLDEKGNKLAIASSKWVLLNIDIHHISKITPEIANAFSPVCESVFDTEVQKLKEPDFYESNFKYTILRRDIDTNKHLNNLNYIVLAQQALPHDVYENVSFSSIEVMYKFQCVLGDAVIFKYHKVSDNEHIISVKSSDESVLHAVVRFIC